MNLPAFCIRRPAFTIVISLVMVIVGLIGFTHLPVRWIPNVTPPFITISTEYPGASAKLVEHDVTKPLEESLSGINGVDTISSVSRRDQSDISINFKLGRNMDAAVEDIRGNIEKVRGILPKDVKNPQVLKADPNNNPILFISFSDEHRDARELSDYIDKYIVRSLETVDGVGSIAFYGKRVTAMQIKLDPARMAGANVTVDEVADALREQSVSIPSGQIRGHDRFYSVITDTSLKTVPQFNDLVVRANQGQIVRLRDIGEAKFDAEDSDTSFRINGKPGIALGIIPQSNANPLKVEKDVRKMFAEIQRTLPAGMQAKIVHSDADYIRASIHSVYESLIEAVVFVWLVIFAFLCSFRATLIPLVTIPVCIVSSFAILYFFGFSINVITLMALVLAIGLVVDDAIVMLENISRHMEQGLSAFAAALKGSREIVFPVIAMTLTLAAVYAPIAFTPGLLGVLFREFTFTLAGAVIISGVVALTLSPMMCSRVLKLTHEPSRYQNWVTTTLHNVQLRYQDILSVLLRKRIWVIAAMLFFAGIGVVIYHFIPLALAPQEDMDEVQVHVSAPRSASYEYTDQSVREMEDIYKQIPEIDSYLTINYSAAHSFHFLSLKPRSERHRSVDSIVSDINAHANALTNVRVNAYAPPPPLAEFAGGDDGDSLGLALVTAGDYQHLQQYSARMAEAIRKIPGFSHAENSLKWDNEQFLINIDRDRAADLRVSIPDIANTISTLVAGKNVGKTEDANIFIKLNARSLADPNIFQQLYVRNLSGVMVPLSGLVNVGVGTSPEVFRHHERMRADSIFLSLSPELKIADAIKKLESIAKENLPDDIRYTFTGEAKSFLESSGQTFLTFMLALVFIYLVLVAQFESFIDPLIIMLTVPFAVVGALLTLLLFGGSINIYSNIGLITLVGLIAKHGILITDFANELRRAGASIEEAVLEAARLRLRPILMTTAAMVLGALPLALAFGPGSESRQQIGLVITGGLVLGTFFSLVVVPITYTYLAPFRKLKSAVVE